MSGRKEGIKDTLSSKKRVVARKFLGSGTGTTDGPVLDHGVVSGLTVELDLEDGVEEGVLTLSSNEGNLSTSGVGGKHDAVLDEGVLLDNTEDITTGDVVASLGPGDEGPLVSFGEGLGFDTVGDEDALSLVGNILQRTLDTIEDTSHNTGTQLDRQGKTRASDRVTDLQTRGFLVDLNGSRALLQLNDLTDQLLVTNTNQLVHEGTLDVLGDNDRTSNGVNDSLEGLILSKSEGGETRLELSQT